MLPAESLPKKRLIEMTALENGLAKTLCWFLIALGLVVAVQVYLMFGLRFITRNKTSNFLGFGGTYQKGTILKYYPADISFHLYIMFVIAFCLYLPGLFIGEISFLKNPIARLNSPNSILNLYKGLMTLSEFGNNASI